MDNATPRTKKMLAAGAVLLVFGITVPATATDGTPGKPAPGSVGKAEENAFPKGQYENDRNKGFTCDENAGVGGGNPALNPSCDGSAGGSSDNGNPGGNGGGIGGGKSDGGSGGDDGGDWVNDGA
jgi:hypothetical protein